MNQSVVQYIIQFDTGEYVSQNGLTKDFKHAKMYSHQKNAITQAMRIANTHNKVHALLGNCHPVQSFSIISVEICEQDVVINISV